MRPGLGHQKTHYSAPPFIGARVAPSWWQMGKEIEAVEFRPRYWSKLVSETWWGYLNTKQKTIEKGNNETQKYILAF